jgi:hypothetical protein
LNVLLLQRDDLITSPSTAIRPYLRERILETREGSKRCFVPSRLGKCIDLPCQWWN